MRTPTVIFLALPLLAAGATLAPAQQVSPPFAAQQPPTFSEKAGEVLDRITGKPRADTDMRRVLAALRELGPQPIESLTPEQARQQPTPADAVKALLRKEGQAPEQVQAALGVRTTDLTYPTAGGTQPIRVYMPPNARQPAPVIVYYHGGGFVIADLDVYDSTPRAMAAQTGAVVFSVEYRHAPEAKFPAQHEDAVAAYKWVLENAAQHGGNPQRIAVMGESAGGNLAINVAIAARDQNLTVPVHQVLVYPVAGVDMSTPSYQQYSDAQPLNKAMMAWFVGHTVKSDADKSDPRLDLVGRANVASLPPATIVTAQIDPLRSEGEQLAGKLSQAGVATDYRNYDGVTHEFFGMDAVVADAKAAQAFVAQRLKAAFESAAPAAATTGGSSGQSGKR